MHNHARTRVHVSKAGGTECVYKQRAGRGLSTVRPLPVDGKLNMALKNARAVRALDAVCLEAGGRRIGLCRPPPFVGEAVAW